VDLVIFTLGQAAYLGVGAQHLWDRLLDWNAQSTFLLPGLSAAAALWFVQVVTEPARFSRNLHLLVATLIGLLLVAQVLDTLLPSRATFGARLMLTTLALVLVAVLIGVVWRKSDDPDIRVIALGFVPVLVMALFPILRGLNLIPNSIFTRYGLAMGAAVEMPILFYALTLRASRRREAQQRASALPRSDALTGLADRRSLLQRLDAAMVRARSQKHPCALLLVRLANYEAILGEHGRDTLDRALVVTASHLRRGATDIDLAARVGEREFALLIEGPTTADAATSRAQQLVASGLRPVQALQPDITLRLLVVIAMLPDQPLDGAATLQWVQGALGGTSTGRTHTEPRGFLGPLHIARRLPRRLHARPGGAHDRRTAVEGARPARHRRQQGGRGRQHRGRLHGQGDRRPHHRRDDQRQHDDRQAAESRRRPSIRSRPSSRSA
jgi:diguanylate cyclase (GGDEF)-like protein